MVKILDGLAEQKKIQQALITSVQALKHAHITPTLAIILIGNNAPSLLYVERKKKFAESIGVSIRFFHLDEKTLLAECLKLIETLNKDQEVHGILLQLPVPYGLAVNQLIQAIDPIKDVDGLHPLNTGKLVQGEEGLYPCTPQGCMHLIHLWRPTIAGLVAVVVGRSNLVGKPLATLLTHENATVIQAHSQTQNLKEITRLGDILVVAVGKKNLIKKEFVKEGACVIDVGISKGDQERTVGDVDFKEASTVAGAISPVPGGVGPMTISYLMLNLLKSCCLQNKLLCGEIMASHIPSHRF
jgi:methylenetetrahydrofolate dehydrogenase (NADP+)/methenyltetrahydrofolate cyclohydrolase